MSFRASFFHALLGPVLLGSLPAADYSLAPAVLDQGGRPAVSPSYSASFSAAPGGAGGSSNYRLSTGHTGQLFDPDPLDGVVFVLPAGLTADGSGKAITASAAGVGPLDLSYEGRGFTSYVSSPSAPAAPGLYRVRASALSEEYIGSVHHDYVINGPLAVTDALTKTADAALLSIHINDLLANDRRILADGRAASGGLFITGVTAGPGNHVRLGEGADAGWIFFTPSSAMVEAFSYLLSDGMAVAQGVVTVTTSGATPPFTLEVVRRGLPVFDELRTTLSMDFMGAPGQIYQLEWGTDLVTWNAAGTFATGLTGSFTATISRQGDCRADWNQSLFFRATR